MKQTPDISNRRVRSRVAVATVFLIVAGTILVPTGFARIARNTIDPLATLSHNGTRIRLTGPIQATAGEWVRQHVTVTQRSTGGVAHGYLHFRATGQIQQWEVIAHVEGSAKFRPGSATVVGMARTTANGKPTDAHQWLVNITLQRQ
jgi:hypothetical protein